MNEVPFSAIVPKRGYLYSECKITSVLVLIFCPVALSNRSFATAASENWVEFPI